MSKSISLLILKRFFSSLLTLFLFISFLFVIVRLSPGNPTDKYISPKLGNELAEKVAEKFSLNKPVINQYFSFISNAIKGDLGISYNYRQPVFNIVWEYFSFTLLLAGICFVIQIFFSICFALWTTKRNNFKLNRIISNAALMIYSVPAFVLGVLLIYLFAVHLDLFPVSGLKSLDYERFTFFGKISDRILHLILPVITLSAGSIAMFYQYIKDGMDDVLNQTFITNLKASGMNEKKILVKHVIPNALRPLISVAGLELGILLGGTLITEVIFSLPGMGRLAIDSVLSRDYPMIIACVSTAGLAMILANFLADILKYKIDKRMIEGVLN